MPSTLADWLIYLESLHPKTIALGLERVTRVKQRLNLQPDFPIITVGGTNGKGSVCAMLESILHAAGYRVGCYTSPHLIDYNERVRIGKKQVSDAELCTSFEKIEQARCAKTTVEQNDGDQTLNVSADVIPLTYFEFGTLAAIQCFIGRRVDVAILEVGLGGRLDAVNAFDSECAVVTSVDIDHVDYLGDTREKIGFEKAGIFRSGKVAICADSDTPQTVVSYAEQIGAILWQSGQEFSFVENSLPVSSAGSAREGEKRHIEIRTIPIAQSDKLADAHSNEHEQKQWNYRGPGGLRNSLSHPALRGSYQLNNASAVLAVLDALKERLHVSMAAVRRGLAEVVLPGRFQVLPGTPQIILDVAHNPHAARSLAQSLLSLPPCPKTFAVFAMLKDKDIAGVVQALKDQVAVWLVAGIDAPRGATATEIASVLVADGVKGRVYEFASIENALQQACNEAAENDRIAVFGSFYTVAEVMRVRGLRVG